MARRKSVGPRFGVHPSLETVLADVDDDGLGDLEALLPAQRRLHSRELIAAALVCVDAVTADVSKTQRGEFDRLVTLAQSALVGSAPNPSDLAAARRDLEHARGLLRIAALAACVAAEGGVDGARLVGDAGRLVLRHLDKDAEPRQRFLRALFDVFR